MDIQIELRVDGAEADSALVSRQLDRFNMQHTQLEEHTLLKVFARTEKGELIGGLLGETFWHWLYISDLWVSELYRHNGIGTQLMAAAEAEAVRRGCKHAYLDTIDFQAPGFYAKLAYTVWGVLDDFPPNYKRIFFKKDL